MRDARPSSRGGRSTPDPARQLLQAPLGLQLLALIHDHGASELSDMELDAFLLRVPLMASRFRGDYDLHVASLKASATKYEELARWLPHRKPGWWANVDRSHQVWAGRTPDPPDASRFAPELTQMHGEAPKPRYAFWTSTLTPGYVSPWLEWPEGQFDGPATVWRMVVHASAKVAEIHSPEDWSALCHRYPGRSGVPSRLDPDWGAVRDDWDGVHLSVGGWLTAEDAPFSANGDPTELRGWNMESTVWLRWAFDGAERLAAGVGTA